MWRTGRAAGARRSNIAIRRSFSPHYKAVESIHPIVNNNRFGHAIYDRFLPAIAAFSHGVRR
jgi:hypothetical protein